jgi:dienelactone hydrolase
VPSRKLTVLLSLACLASPLCAQTLEITPKRALVDESVTIRASGLQPGEHATIRAELLDGAEHRWKSEAEFTADAQGVVDATRDAPGKGSYKSVSAMGLVWSMLTSDKNVGGYVSPHELQPQTITFSLLRNGSVVSTAELQQLHIAENVRRLNLRGAIHGALFLPETAERRPGVLVLGGSEGGLNVEKAAWLASHGYPSLALAYFRYEDLPSQLANIPLEYFVGALQWLRQRPEILPDRIAVMGTSRGGELALLLGSLMPEIKAVVAYVPASYVHPACCLQTPVPYAWTWQGKPIAYVSFREMRDFARIQQAAIHVEQIHAPILVISGESDGIWESASMADAVTDRLKHAHFAFAYENLKYPHAGHRAGRPEIVPTWHGRSTHPISGKSIDFGGNAEGDAASSLDAIPKVLQFLRDSLQPTAAATLPAVPAN